MAQISDVKAKLLEEPEKIVELLETYNFEHISLRQNEIRMARNQEGGPNISMRLQGNEWCNISDYARGYRGDIFSFIAQERGATFREVLLATKKILGLGDDWEPKRKYQLFGGIYSHISKNSEYTPKTYDESILNQYKRQGNLLWLKDGISLSVQREFSICFNVADNSIVIPWRNQFSEIIAIKHRVNGIPEESMPKYYYSTSTGGCISSSLYGYSENYPYLQNTDLLLGESEKQVLQLATKGYRNALSLGSNSLSRQQAALILSLNPKRIIWLLDEGLPKENTLKNAQVIKEYCTMRSVEQYWWNWESSLSVPSGSKMSPGDCNKEVFEDILKYELEKIDEELTDDEI